MKIRDLAKLQELRAAGLAKLLPTQQARIAVGMGTCGMGTGAEEVYQALAHELDRRQLPALLTQTGCFGCCALEPLVNIRLPGQPLVMLSKVTRAAVPKLVAALAKGEIPRDHALCRIETWDHLTAEPLVYGEGFADIPKWNEVPFFKWQKKIVLRDCGLINPDDIGEYLAVGGYAALFAALRGTPEAVLEQVKLSGLRGRGGAGFPVWRKWDLMKRETADMKYIICNADEGDPGAYMNRNEIESDPHMLIEGMILGAFTMGAAEGILYVRAEYPLAVARLKNAVTQARELGILGPDILGSGFAFDLHLVEGAGAFVCGEETALIASIEGRAGRPRTRPPFPSRKGLWDKPTTINNVETWCNIPAILAKGGAWFTKTGTAGSPGTKVFSLVGKVKNTGLVELPLGETLATLVYKIGGGAPVGKAVKAIQSGGPSGGCIPTRLFSTPIQYESLQALGAIMGSGGMVVMDQDNCMVDVARYFLEFTTSESCGKCVPCREGLNQVLRLLKAITEGRGELADLDRLEHLAQVIGDTALCGLGQTGPNPVLTTLRYFRTEYEQHIKEKRCEAGECGALFRAPCENSCPLHMNIPGYLQLLKEHRMQDAFELVIRDNPLPATTGRICRYHCRVRCRRADADEAVAQGEVHRYIADYAYNTGLADPVHEKLLDERLPATGKKIAIVGAGPAGVTAAYYLARLGHAVTIYDANEGPGGIVRFTIPEYRLPRAVLEREIGFIKRFGVKFKYRTRVGKDVQLAQLAHDFDAVFVAIGAQGSAGLEIPGIALRGVIPGVEFLEEVARDRRPDVGKQVCVIGAGNVAIDAARSARRIGAQVTVIYRRERADMSAHADEVHEAEQEGVKFRFLAAPKSVVGSMGIVTGLEIERMTPGDVDFSGRRTPMASGHTEVLPCETVMLAIGERVNADFLKPLGINVRPDGTVEVHPLTLQTSHPKIYAGGDATIGPSTASEAMASGKKVAEVIDRQLMIGQNRFQQLFREIPYSNEVPEVPQAGGKRPLRELPVAARRGNFWEISSGLSEKNALAEACRCLRCDVK
jgi:NADH-quinone oxidoreductase subunit F